MEKRTPHYALSMVRTLIAEGRVETTRTALLGARSLGIDRAGMVSVVLGLTSACFYKSMTTHFDHRVWQDVYRPITPEGPVYLKLTVLDGLLIVSFKALLIEEFQK